MKLRTSNLNGFNHVLSNREFNKRAMLTFALYNNAMEYGIRRNNKWS